MKRILWSIFCFVLWATQLIRFFRYRKRARGIILCYRGISGEVESKQPWNSDGRYLSVKRYNRQIRYLRKYYKIVALSEIASSVEKSEAVAEKSVALTFNCGYKNTYLYALKPLIECSLPFGLSLVTTFLQKDDLIWFDRLELAISRSRSRDLKVKVGGYFIDEKIATARQKKRVFLLLKSIGAGLDLSKRNMFLTEIENQSQYSANENGDYPDDCISMDIRQVIETVESGADLGSYSSHLVDIRHIPRRNLLEEIYESRRYLNDTIGKECSFFVFPMWYAGNSDEVLQELVEKSGYSFALTNIPAFVGNNANPYFLPMITICDNDNFFVFAAKLAGIGIKRNLI